MVRPADHYLALDISTAIIPSDDPSANIDAVRRQGGIGIIAHPTGGAIVKGEYFEYPWTDWDAGPFDGIEVWNHAYDITGRPKNIFQLLFNLLLPRAAKSGPIQSVLDTWDLYSLRQSRRILGVGGADAHGWPGSYRADFGTVCTYILTEEPFSNNAACDRALVYDALRAGRCYLGADKVAKASGFRCEVACGRDTVQMGGVRCDPGEIRRRTSGHFELPRSLPCRSPAPCLREICAMDIWQPLFPCMNMMEIQTRLARLGFDPGACDGRYGPLTRDAVRQCQAAYRLVPDGVPGPELKRLLSQDLPSCRVTVRVEEGQTLSGVARCHTQTGGRGPGRALE